MKGPSSARCVLDCSIVGENGQSGTKTRCILAQSAFTRNGTPPHLHRPAALRNPGNPDAAHTPWSTKNYPNRCLMARQLLLRGQWWCAQDAVVCSKQVTPLSLCPPASLDQEAGGVFSTDTGHQAFIKPSPSPHHALIKLSSSPRQALVKLSSNPH